MCTALTFGTNPLYFGRNMDLEYTFGESVVITPRDCPLPMKCCAPLTSHYAMIGMASVVNQYPLYAEAANEWGLCMAGLNFPGNACYLPQAQAVKRPVAPYELILQVLGTCKDLDQARALLDQLDIVAVPFLPTLPLAPLHWIIAHRQGSLTVECTQSGLHVYGNPYGVLTNNPPFPFHRENLRQFLNLSPRYPENRFAPEYPLSPFGQGAGALGLPGDFSPASRFVKALFCKENSSCPTDEPSCVAQVFHILDSVAMVRGTVITPEGKPDYTTYSCCIQADAGRYYYKTYENNQITQIALTPERREGEALLVFPLNRSQQIRVE